MSGFLGALAVLGDLGRAKPKKLKRRVMRETAGGTFQCWDGQWVSDLSNCAGQTEPAAPTVPPPPKPKVTKVDQPKKASPGRKACKDKWTKPELSVTFDEAKQKTEAELLAKMVFLIKKYEVPLNVAFSDIRFVPAKADPRFCKVFGYHAMALRWLYAMNNCLSALAAANPLDAPEFDGFNAENAADFSDIKGILPKLAQMWPPSEATLVRLRGEGELAVEVAYKLCSLLSNALAQGSNLDPFSAPRTKKRGLPSKISNILGDKMTRNNLVAAAKLIFTAPLEPSLMASKIIIETASTPAGTYTASGGAASRGVSGFGEMSSSTKTLLLAGGVALALWWLAKRK